VGAIDTSLVMKILEPNWTAKTETMARIRGRIESVLNWAKVRGYRTGENPALWRGHLDKLLPAKGKVIKRGHYETLPYKDAAAFMAALRQRENVTARALEFIIMTAVRVSDVLGSAREDRTPMLWSHVACDVWTIPDTKNDKAHLVPLSNQALAVLDKVRGFDRERVFPGINNRSILHLLQTQMKATATSAHKRWRCVGPERGGSPA
jgi:integrase